MISISAEYLLATIFHEIDRISYQKFREVARDIESLTGAVVMNSRDDIAFVRDYYSENFDFQDDFIVKKADLDPDYYYYEFVITVPPDIHKRVKSYVLQEKTPRNNRSGSVV